MKMVLIIMIVIVAFLILVYVNHRVQSKKEEKTLTPTGSWLLWTDMICACIPAERGT